jgi:hypothetical protein
MNRIHLTEDGLLMQRSCGKEYWGKMIKFFLNHNSIFELSSLRIISGNGKNLLINQKISKAKRY